MVVIPGPAEGRNPEFRAAMQALVALDSGLACFASAPE